MVFSIRCILRKDKVENIFIRDAKIVTSGLFKVIERQAINSKPSQRRRRSSVFPSELMEEKLTNLLNSISALRARNSIKYMISIFR